MGYGLAISGVINFALSVILGTIMRNWHNIKIL